MKLTLGRKILVGFVVCAAILITVAFFSFSNSEKFIAAAGLVTHTHEVLNEYDRLLGATIDAESAVRGYVVSSDESFLVPYNQARVNIPNHFALLKRLTSDNQEQQTNIAEMSKQVALRMAHLEMVVGFQQQDPGKAKEAISNNAGKDLQEELKRLADNGRRIESELLDTRRKASDSDARSFTIVFSLLIIIIAAVLLAVYFIIHSNLRALHKAEAETASKNWILTGHLQLTEKIRGEQTTDQLATGIIEQICRYLDAQLGIFYVYENGRLHLAGTYAFYPGKENKTSILPGEGLAGQAAAEKKPILFKEVPTDYTRINSGLGNTVPKNIITQPILHDNELKGVLEIGSVRAFTQADLQLLNMVSENTAIAISAAQSRSKQKELLEETQRQAEELEAQQEELKQTNEELQEKTEMLQRNEAELKAQQEELQQSNEELEEKANLLEEQTGKLESARDDIEQKANALELTGKYKSEFLANMSHELRTPLNSILILSQLLSENKNNTLNEKETVFARNIHNSGNDLLNLINEILDLSKVESGKIELDITPVAITDITGEMNGLFTELALSKSIQFNIEQAESLPELITTDRQRLSQIIKNLLSNAFKFTGKNGKVTLAVTTLEAPGSQPMIAFHVTDNGIGIPQDKLAIIFEAFQQADGSTKRKYGGTGLGLSISRELASALGGAVRVESEEGTGSRFSLYIPVTYTGPALPAAKSNVSIRENPVRPARDLTTAPPVIPGEMDDDREDIRAADRVVLIMEDDISFAGILLSYVRERNYKGIVATQGNTGLSYARLYKPDAILLDMNLPVTDGGEVLRHLKNDPQLRHIPVQIISGYDRRRESLELGAFDFIQKPVDHDGLRNIFEKIEDFISRKLKKLLVVEDNEQQNMAIRELIGNGDVKSYSAYSGEEAYRLLQDDLFDCVIVDLGLPGMTGFDLLEKIKSSDRLQKMPVIVYTGKDLTREENNLLLKFANTVVLKTADSQERLLDETMLFLHRVESQLPKEKQHLIRKLHKADEVLRNKTVLLVDDDIRNIYSLTHVLEEEGMHCLTAENGKVALARLEENRGADIVLMDVMMPEMDGYEATREIRNHPLFSKLPVIALTAKAMKGDREKCLAAGMSDYVPKPVNIEQLLSLLRVWLYR